jgi:hypothetical protein
MKKVFTIQRNKNQIVLFNLKDIDGLKKGDIFFRRNEDNTTEILQDFEYLDKEYLDNILDKLSEEEQYDFSLLETKSI